MAADRSTGGEAGSRSPTTAGGVSRAASSRSARRAASTVAGGPAPVRTALSSATEASNASASSCRRPRAARRRPTSRTARRTSAERHGEQDDRVVIVEAVRDPRDRREVVEAGPVSIGDAGPQRVEAVPIRASTGPDRFHRTVDHRDDRFRLLLERGRQVGAEASPAEVHEELVERGGGIASDGFDLVEIGHAIDARGADPGGDAAEQRVTRRGGVGPRPPRPRTAPRHPDPTPPPPP